MSNLGTRTKNINLVIRKNKEINENTFNEWLSLNCDKYAYIKHEKDINLNGELEGVHYHAVITLLKQQRLSTVLNSLCDALLFDNPFGIEISKTNNLEGSIQYLIHKNDPQKTQHSVDEIIHNWPVSELLTIINCDVNNGALTYERVYSVCKESSNILEVIEALGFGRYHLYRSVINDIFKEVRLQNSNNRKLLEVMGEYNALLDLFTRALNNIKLSLPKADRRIACIEKWENELAGRFKYYE